MPSKTPTDRDEPLILRLPHPEDSPRRRVLVMVGGPGLFELAFVSPLGLDDGVADASVPGRAFFIEDAGWFTFDPAAGDVPRVPCGNGSPKHDPSPA